MNIVAYKSCDDFDLFKVKKSNGEYGYCKGKLSGNIPENGIEVIDESTYLETDKREIIF